MANFHPLHHEVSSLLRSRHHMTADARWLNDFLLTRGLNPPPLPSLVSTANFRILTSDITTSLSSQSDPANLLPHGVDDINVKDRKLDGPVIVQVLDILDVGTSKLSQVEAIERIEQGEEIHGREIIRTVDATGHDGEAAGARGDPATHAFSGSANPATTTASASTSYSSTNKLSAGPHRLILQDANGTKVAAFEMAKVPKIELSLSAMALVPASATSQGASSTPTNHDDSGMFIGCKLLLKPGAVVRRGMVMLTPETCVVLGGKVEAWDKKWKRERKQKLTEMVRHQEGAS